MRIIPGPAPPAAVPSFRRLRTPRAILGRSATTSTAALPIQPIPWTRLRLTPTTVKAELAERGIRVKEAPAVELDEAQTAALNDGGVVIKPAVINGKVEFKAYNAASGKDVSKTFYAKQEQAKPQPVPLPEVKKEPVQPVAAIELPKEEAKLEEPAPKPVAKSNNSQALAGSRNHFGLSAGISKLKKNEDSLELLAHNNPGGSNRYADVSGRFQLFYERDLSARYALGIAAGMSRGGDALYDDNSGKTLTVADKNNTVTLYVMRRFGKHFGLYLGGGMQAASFNVIDEGNMAGTTLSHPPFKGTISSPYGEAGMVLTGRHLSLRLTVRQIMSGHPSDITSTFADGVKYRLIVKDGKTLGYKALGDPLAGDERYFNVGLGGMAAGISLAYSF